MLAGQLPVFLHPFGAGEGMELDEQQHAAALREVDKGLLDMWKRRELGRKGRRIEGDSLLSAVTEQGTALFFMVVAMAEYPVLAGPAGLPQPQIFLLERKSTRLNSSHANNSYAV